MEALIHQYSPLFLGFGGVGFIFLLLFGVARYYKNYRPSIFLIYLSLISSFSLLIYVALNLKFIYPVNEITWTSFIALLVGAYMMRFYSGEMRFRELHKEEFE